LKYLRFTYAVILISLLLAGCRNPFAPSGGEVSPTPATLSTTETSAATSPISTPAIETAPESITPIPTVFSSPLTQSDSVPAAADILQAVYGEALQGNMEDGYHVGEVTVPWVGPVASGSFTGRGTTQSAAPTQWAALIGGEAGNSSDLSSDEQYLSIRWVILGTSASSSDLVTIGRSPSLRYNVAQTEESWRVGGLSDFDRDGAQELIAVSSTRGGIQRQTTHLFRWDGAEFAQVWSASTFEDNTSADSAPTYYIYEATVNLRTEDGNPTIMLESTTRYFAKNAEGRANTASVTQSDTSTQRYRWDGRTFMAHTPGGPQETFAYSTGAGLWLWVDANAQQIDDRRVSNIDWSQDGNQLVYVVWWPSDAKGIWLYDIPTGSRTQVSPVEGAVYDMQRSPGGDVLAYVQAVPAQVRISSLTDNSSLTVEAVAQGISWSPDGTQLVYDHSGSLSRYDLAAQRSQMLVEAGESAGDSSPGIYSPAWSPRGDLIAAIVRQEGTEQPTLIEASSSNPLPADDLAQRAIGIQAPNVDINWSPSGEQFAVLTSDPASGSAPGAVYIIDVAAGTGTLRKLVEASSAADPVSLPVWNSTGDRLAAIVGPDVIVWDTATGGGTTWHTFPAAAEESNIAWSPDGLGLLVSYGAELFWFAAGEPGEPMLLLKDIAIESLQFAKP